MNSLNAFISVAKEQSFAAAGLKLGLTRSAIGKSVARLEQQLGVRLFHRTTRSLSLTAEGSLFYQRCAQALQDLEEAAANIRQDKPYPKGTLKLTVAAAFGRSQLLPVLRDYAERWPEVKIEVNFSDGVKDLIEGGLDLAIRLGVPPDDTSNLVVRTLTRFSSAMVASPDYLHRQGKPETLADIIHHDRLMYGTHYRPLSWQLLHSQGEVTDIRGNDRCYFDSAEALRDAAVAGMGIALLPEFIIRQSVNNGELIPLFAEYRTNEIPVYILYPTRRYLTAKVRCFIDMLVDAVG
ncbi:LysR family transcriptional regulator [Biostraticola tofi]|nr:LysR family transcriptional regulator [Biostraticola tofi]